MSAPLLRLRPSLNWQVTLPVVAGALLAVGLGELVCCAVALAGGDGAVLAFALPCAVLIPAGLGGLLVSRGLTAMPLRPRDGFLAVTMAWIAAAAAGAAPFLIEGTFGPVVDAFFESMSGFTTTGATLLDDIEAQPDAMLLWRSLTQWLGGVGIVVLVVAIAPATGLAGQRAFYAETSGVTTDRLTPRIASTAKIICGVYLILTTIGLLAYWAAGMTPWEAINHSFTTVATGGFSTRTASIAGFDSLAIELVAIVLMTAAGVNFAFYWLALHDRRRIWPQAAEVRAYLLIIAAVTAALTVALMLSDAMQATDALRASSFTVVSVITTTGYTTVDFDTWHAFARLTLLLLMFVGACAGSTAGGMKVIRVLLLGKVASQELRRQLQPSAVQVLRLPGRVYPEAVRRGVLGFFLLYMAVFAVGSLAMAAIGLDEISAVSSVATTLNVIGPGLGDVGATDNFRSVPPGGLWLLSGLMLAGRLEVFTVIVLLIPAFWRARAA